MTDARQKFVFSLFGAKLFVALLFVLLGNILCQAQTADSETCVFSEYKTFWRSHFIPGSLIEEAKPVYPPAARAVRAQGKVRVKILVDRRGRVRETCVLEGHPLLRAAAVQAARETTFKPNFGFSSPLKGKGKDKIFLTDELVYNFSYCK